MKNSTDNLIKTLYYQRMETASTINDINSNVVRVIIDVTIVFSSFVGRKEERHEFLKDSNDKYMFKVQCPNNDCTVGFIDLSSEVFFAVKSGNMNEGTKRCCGQEKKYKHTKGFHCETKIIYKIEPILEK